jgi:uncharacterized protein YdeI (YjbR/CyaY-like superfamily)
MAAFKNHCAFGFWKASLLKDIEKRLSLADRASMGHFNQITSLKDLPPDKTLLDYIREAAQLNEDGVKLPSKIRAQEKKQLPMPKSLTLALKGSKAAALQFEEFSISAKNEYISWVEEAKTETTREKRINTAIEWISEGKTRNWKYK